VIDVFDEPDGSLQTYSPASSELISDISNRAPPECVDTFDTLVRDT